MKTVQTQTNREIPPMPGGGSWTFNEAQWAWISSDPAAAEAPEEATMAAPGNDQAAQAADQE